MYRIEYRKPGCLLWALFFVIASFVAAFPAGLLRLASARWGYLTFAVLVVVLMWLQARLMRRLTQRHVPICPHCGVATDPTFRVCRSCGRVK